MLPGLNGFEILKELRKQNCTDKIIMLTAKSLLEDKLEGLENGANDYLTKPFHYEELIARVRIQLNQTNLKHQDQIEYEDLILNQKTWINLDKMVIGGLPVALMTASLSVGTHYLTNRLVNTSSIEQMGASAGGIQIQMWNIQVMQPLVKIKQSLQEAMIQVKLIKMLYL